MKKCLFLLAAIWLTARNCNALINNVKDEMAILENALSMRSAIEDMKRARIDSLNHSAAISDSAYTIYRNLYEEYRSYNYDTALIYIDLMEREATASEQAEVQLDRAFVYLSGGLFKESADILEQWSSTDSLLLREYYLVYVRLLWDLADNAGGAIGAEYNRQANRLNHQLLSYLTPADSARYWYSRAMLDMHEANHTLAIERLQTALNVTQPSVHYEAIILSTLAYLYRLTGNDDAAFDCYVRAAVCDIRSSTYETVALRYIAEMLFEAGETEAADRYIHLAMQDATRYHARHRQVGIAQSLPIIEERMLSQIRFQQRLAWGLLAVVVVLLVIGMGGITVLVRKNKAVHAAQATIDGMNQSLLEANKLKEELLGTLLTSRSQYISAVLQYQQEVRQSAVNRRWSELMTVPKAADARMQRTVLDHQIDTIFLSLYPTFVQDFNALLRPEEQIVLKKEELLNAQLRIFALIRLGITHNEVIAQILDYSINTVYSYKTRVIAASNLSPDAFYAALMQIPSFSH